MKALGAVFVLVTLTMAIACGASASSPEPAVSAGSQVNAEPLPISTTLPSPTSEIPVTTAGDPAASTAPVPTEPAPVTTDSVPITSATAPTTTVQPVLTEPAILTDSVLIDEAIQAAAEQYGAVGVQVAVISDGRVSAAAEYGWAVLDETPMEQDTKIRVASLTKTLIGMVTFRLIEEGMLELDADISAYIGVEVRNPAYPNDPITLRMLLSHTSSMKNAGYVTTLSGLQKQLQRASTYQNDRPGEKFAYNNFGFGVIGSICEIVTGKPMNTLAKEYFFEPMGIEATFAPSELDASMLAVIYTGEGEVGRSIAQQQSITPPTAPVEHMRHYAGGLTISAIDYAKLLTILINDGVYNGERYLSQESVELMESVQLTKSNGTMQCMPIWKYEGLYGADACYYHTGSNYGVYALYTYDPNTGFGTVVVTTGAKKVYDSNKIYAVCSTITKAIYQGKEEIFGSDTGSDEA